MASIKKDPPTTIDEEPARLPVTGEESAPTRYVRPYVDHSVEHPRSSPASASQLAAMLPPAESSESGLRGRLVQADFDGGDFTLRLSNATASMRALAQLLAAQGLEVEILVRRRSC